MRLLLSKSRSHSYQRVSREGDPEAPSGAFPFLRLPSEIRNMVYRELLLSAYPFIMHLRIAFWYENGKRPYPAILQTNKQIHDEAAAVLYGENTWFSSAGNSFFPWADEYRQGHRGTYDIPPGPSSTYMAWITRFVLFYDGPPAWVRSRVVAAGDVTTMLTRMGIKRNGLLELVVATLESERCDQIASTNEDWLEVVDDAEMAQRFGWFQDRGTQPAFWLTLKKRPHQSTNH
ncbi:hypothetical protein N0V90_009929 [Kalmusia sp. IMI 367209]|nr:hypothetical protein N0V90_009929 [Kalmusia sp. IMI 367209]